MASSQRRGQFGRSRARIDGDSDTCVQAEADRLQRA
jgi:hypothetical protein